MRAWYDIVSSDFSTRREDPAGVRESAALIEALIARENARGIPDSRIVLAGFSQGRAIALHTALRHPNRLAGVLALSHLPAAGRHAGRRGRRRQREDPDLHGPRSGRSGDSLRFRQSLRRPPEGGRLSLEWRTYPMDHSLCLEEVQDLELWLAHVMSR